jgi:hypothetical protein
MLSRQGKKRGAAKNSVVAGSLDRLQDSCVELAAFDFCFLFFPSSQPIHYFIP